MKKRYSTRLITSRRSYSTLELATLLGTHPQTVRTWRTKGLQPIDDSTHSPLYFGSDVKKFLISQEQKRKIVLGEGEFCCFHCKSAQKATDIEIVDTGRQIGHELTSTRLIGKCSNCGGKVHKFSTTQTKLLTEGKGINIELPTSL